MWKLFIILPKKYTKYLMFPVKKNIKWNEKMALSTRRGLDSLLPINKININKQSKGTLIMAWTCICADCILDYSILFRVKEVPLTAQGINESNNQWPKPLVLYSTSKQRNGKMNWNKLSTDETISHESDVTTKERVIFPNTGNYYFDSYWNLLNRSEIANH